MKHWKWLMNEEDEFGTSGGGGVVEMGEEGGEETPKVPSFDPNEFARTFGQEFARVQTQQQQSKQPSIEDFRKETEYYAVEDQDIIDLYGEPSGETDVEKRAWLDKRKMAQQKLLDKSVNHANKVAGLMTRYSVADLKKEFEPIVHETQRRKFDGYVKGLANAHPTFKEMSNGTELIKTAIGMLQQQGYRPQGKDADQKAVHEMAENIVKMAGGDVGQARISSTGSHGGGGRANGMGTSVNGAGAGSGGSGAGKSNKQPWQKLPF
jgi:hypothetical protein